jgi:hypothetical protein
MPQLGNYYIDATTLSGATAVFIDAALTTPAANGYYSDGQVVRQQIGGLLAAPNNCPNCLFPCNNAVSTNTGTQGIYQVSYDAGVNAGALVVWFRPISNSVLGVRFTYDSNDFSFGTSENFGYFSAASNNNFSYIGLTAGDCGIAAQLGAGGYSNLDQFVFDGTNFGQAGSNGTVTGNALDVNTTVTTPGWCTMYTNFTPGQSNTVLMEIAAVCATAKFELELPCPVFLTGVSSSNVGGVCGDAKPNTYFNVPNRNGQPGVPEVNEFMVEDSGAANSLAAGDYCIEDVNGDEKVITVDANSVITNIVICP